MSIPALRWIFALSDDDPEYQALSHTERHVLTMIAWHLDKLTNDAFPGIPRMALVVGVSERTVQRALRVLEERGFIRTLRQSGGTERVPDHLRPNLYVWNRGIRMADPRLDTPVDEHVEKPVNNKRVSG